MRYAYIPSATTARWREWVLSVIVALAVVCVPGVATAQEGQPPPGATTPVPASSSPATSSAAPAASVKTQSPQQAFEPNAFPEGLDVVEVRVLDSTGSVIAKKPPAIPLSAGKPFDFDEERESLRALYRTGDYADVQASATAVPGGVRIDFTTTNNFYNNVVRVYGLKEPPTEAAALAAMRLGLGEPFRESSLREAIDRLKDVLQSEGIFTPHITWDLHPHAETRQMDIFVTVVPGARATVGSFAVKNETKISDTELINKSKIKLNTRLTTARLNRATQRLKKYFLQQGYLGASIFISPGVYDAANNTVPLQYNVSTGPRVRVEINGAKVSKDKLRQLVPVYQEGAVDNDLLQEGRRNIRDYFQGLGYFNADVEVSSKDDPAQQERVIAFDVTRGDKYRLAGVGFNGNKYFSRTLLASRLALQPASFASNGKFSQNLVRSDTDSIKNLYLSNGFLDAQVAAETNVNYENKKNNLFVAFNVMEGPQTKVETLTLEGNKDLSNDTLLNVIGSSPGQPYSAAGVASDRNNILAMYYNEGYPEASFQERETPGDAPTEVKLVYQIVEGPRVEVAQVLYTGYQFTRPGIIKRQSVIKAGGPLREGDVVETQRQLYNLGVFTRVQIAPQNPAGTDPDKTMVVDVQEGSRYTIGYGGGFEVLSIAGAGNNPNGTSIVASPRGILEVARSNMFGRAQTLSFRARASTLQYRALLAYTADQFLGFKTLSASLTGFADKTLDVDTFTSIRYEGAFQVTQKLSSSSSVQYRYFFRRVLASDLNGKVSQDQIPLYSQPTLVSGFGITYVRDRRDNPTEAKHGTFNSLDLSISSRTLGSSASFARGFFQNSSFYSFGRDFVFARSTRFGIEHVFGGSQEIDVPLPERFFAGGGQSLRGFSLNQAGPRDPVTGFPIGGLGLLMFNQELRFPMKLPVIGNKLGGTIFYDGGNVFSDVDHINLHWKSKSDTELNYFSHTVGFGVRYPTPIGPVRVDIGYLLNPAQYPATVCEAPTNPLPVPCPPPYQVTRTYTLPHVGFSFNIGAVF
jgi:outer membrane protein insertion porin family